MTPHGFHHLVDDYLTARRGLGFDLETAEGLLRDFASHADRIGHSGPVTIALAVQWARASRSSNPAQAARRLAVVRQFARYRALFDPATEVPPVGLLGRTPRRPLPHIYTEAEMAALLQQASCLLPRHGLRPATYVAYFALLASTGLRLSEACRLTTDDVDLVNGILTIRETKFRKSRLVPLHPTTTQALARYADHRDACLAAPRSDYFFRTELAPRLTSDAVETTFRRIKQRLDWTGHAHASPHLISSDHAEDISIDPLFHEHASERLHQRTNPILWPIGKMVIQHQPLPKQRMRPPLHRVRLQRSYPMRSPAAPSNDSTAIANALSNNRRSRRSGRETCIDDRPIPKRMSLMSRNPASIPQRLP